MRDGLYQATTKYLCAGFVVVDNKRITKIAIGLGDQLV